MHYLLQVYLISKAACNEPLLSVPLKTALLLSSDIFDQF